MDNRIILNQTFRSEYFNPGVDKKTKKDEAVVDFYIFFKQQDVSLDSVCAFHVPYSCLYSFLNSLTYIEEESLIMDIILHHNLVETLNNHSTTIEELYYSLLDYFCIGGEMRYMVDTYPEGGFGLVGLFDEDYHNPSITSMLEPEVNQGRFYL